MPQQSFPLDTEFIGFCDAVHSWLAGGPDLDPALVAVAAFLARQRTSSEREVAHLANRPEDALVALGAGTLLSLWSAARSGSLEPAQVGGV